MKNVLTLSFSAELPERFFRCVYAGSGFVRRTLSSSSSSLTPLSGRRFLEKMAGIGTADHLGKVGVVGVFHFENRSGFAYFGLGIYDRFIFCLLLRRRKNPNNMATKRTPVTETIDAINATGALRGIDPIPPTGFGEAEGGGCVAMILRGIEEAFVGSIVS